MATMTDESADKDHAASASGGRQNDNRPLSKYEIQDVLLSLDRESSIDKWTALAAGDFSEEVRVWIRVVASRILEADEEKRQKRATAMLKALGLTGRRDKDREAREIALDEHHFWEQSISEITDRLREEGFIDPKIEDQEGYVQMLIRKKRTRVKS